MNLKEQILDIIKDKANLSNAEIAVMAGSTEEEVEQAISDLEKEKVIVGYRTLIDWSKVKKERVTAYIELKVTPEEGRGFEKFAEEMISEFPQVKSVSLMSGSFDFLIEIDGDDMKDIALFVAEKISPINSVVSTRTHFILRRYKQEGIVLNNKNKDERGVITL